ncbi:MAG: XRE family transcriptional regulator [Microbacteriaceae bacterium]|nr:XRE family transcriptional regulator [Microbacteriaceae bacterium]
MSKRVVTLRTPGDIGLALQQARLSQGLTQHDIAGQLGIPQSTVSEMESGKSTIYLRHLLEMARLSKLEISAEWDARAAAALDDSTGNSTDNSTDNAKQAHETRD